jgi:outer membrane lipoprotein-sorting protein
MKTRKIRNWTMAALMLAGFSASAFAQDELHKTLAQMDAASAKFQSAQADFEWDDFEAAVQQTDQQFGSIYFEHKGAETRMAAMLTRPQAKQIVYMGGELKLYEPNIDHLTELTAGQNRALYESFTQLGFGGSGTELEKNWTITLQGHEKVDGIETARLDLVPKVANVKNIYSHITLWIDPVRDVSLKQQAFEPSGDYRTAHYTAIKVNEKIPAAVFIVKTTKKTTVLKK